MFPAGGPGIALLILRVSLAAAILDGAFDCMKPSGRILVCVALGAQSFLLCLGLLTPIVSPVACAFELTGLFIASQADLRFMILCSLNAAVIAMLGPGAYSLDARLFGRRVTILNSGEKPHRR